MRSKVEYFYLNQNIWTILILGFIANICYVQTVITATMPTTKAKVGTYIDQDLKDNLVKLAELESRSVSNYVEILIKEAVAQAQSEGKI